MSGAEEGGSPACWLHLVCEECGHLEEGGATTCSTCGRALPPAA